MPRSVLSLSHANHFLKISRYLYGFEEYCRSANIQFRTIHHNEPKVIEVVPKQEEPMEAASIKDEEPEMFPAEVQDDVEGNDCSSESEKEEAEQRSPRVGLFYRGSLLSDSITSGI